MSCDTKDEKKIFKPGDKVIFECSDLQNSRPRWQFNDDTGASDIWAEGVVSYVDNRVIAVEYKTKEMVNFRVCTWPNVDHEEYDSLQWLQEGYLQPLSIGIICECGAEATYGPDTPHSIWCPKF